MIELVILRHLAENLEVPVYMETPEEPPTEYVIIERTSSSKSNHISRATFAFQSYSDSLYDACLLNDKLMIAADSLVEEKEIASSKLNNYYNFTDQTKKKYRYQAVYDLVYYD